MDNNNTDILINHIENLSDFIMNNKLLSKNFETYIQYNISPLLKNNLIASTLSYILNNNFEKILTKFNKSFSNQNEYSKSISKSLKQNIFGIFEIKKITKNELLLLNLINEKTYKVNPLILKENHIKNIYPNQYIYGNIILFNNNYYLINIKTIKKSSDKSSVYQEVFQKLVQNPNLIFFDNKEKIQEFSKKLNYIYKNFIEFFKSDCVIINNNNANNVIQDFYNFLKNKNKKFDYSKYNYELDLKNSNNYDLGIIFNKKSGLYSIPYYKSFKDIFENKFSLNNNFILVNFIKNKNIPQFIFDEFNKKYENFMEIINKNTNQKLTYNEFLKKYPHNKDKFSQATILYFSDILEKIMEIQTEKENIPTKKISKNSPCPCGSGKKYKNCCKNKIKEKKLIKI